MSKGSMMMGTVRGKLGDTVFFRRGGEQQQRAYIPMVKDAKTEAQYKQRSQLSNVVAFYRTTRTLLDHSFTERPAKQSSYNAFVAANLGKVQVYVTKEQAASGACVCAPYIVSDGVLPSIRINGSGVDAVTDIALGTLASLEGKTIAEVSQAIVNNNPTINWGDQLTYLSLVQSTDVQTGFPIVRAAYYEVTLSASDLRLFSDFMPAQACKVKNGFLAHGEKVADGGFCWILSRKTSGGVLQCSRQELVVTSTTLYKAYASASAMTRALESYGAIPEKLLMPGESTSGGINETPSVSSVVIGDTTLVNGMNWPSTQGWGATPSVTINGSNLADVTNVVMVVTAKKDEVSNSASIPLSGMVAGKTKLTGTITLPANLQGAYLQSVVVNVDDNELYRMTTKETAVDPL